MNCRKRVFSVPAARQMAPRACTEPGSLARLLRRLPTSNGGAVVASGMHALAGLGLPPLSLLLFVPSLSHCALFLVALPGPASSGGARQRWHPGIPFYLFFSLSFFLLAHNSSRGRCASAAPRHHPGERLAERGARARSAPSSKTLFSSPTPDSGEEPCLWRRSLRLRSLQERGLPTC